MNLSQNRARDVQQQEQIGRRTSIIAERRETRAPALESAGNLRTARRGDVGGAEALLRTLGLAQEAGSDIVTYMTNKNALDEKDNIARGFADESVGAVDEEMMNKSLGYRNAVTKGRTVTNFSKASREFDEELKAMIEGQESPILEERLAEIDARIEGFFTNFAQDPETGELRDYLQSPGAMRYLAETIQTTRPKAQAAAREMVETKFKAEAFGHFNTNITEQALETGTVDLAAARTLLPSIVTDEEFAENVFLSVANAARALEEEGRFAEAAGLYAGLRQRTRAPVSTGVELTESVGAPQEGTVNATGTAGQFAAAFKEVGLSDVVIAGFLGNLQHESSFDSSRVGDNGTAFGHAQWREDRVENFKRIVGVHPKNASPEQSVQFIKWELDNYQAAGMTKKQRDAILNAETPEEAARAIDHFYERSDRKSTRDRMKAAREFYGTAPEPAAAPSGTAPESGGLRLQSPFADPITRLEQSGEMVDIIGIEGVQFSPEQVARMDELYASATARMRQAWSVKQAEEQGHNAGAFSLRLLGQGEPLSDKEIRDALAERRISLDDANALFRLSRAEQDRRESAVERAEARADRAEDRRKRKLLEDETAAILAPLITGNLSGGEARSAGLRAAAANPDIGPELLANVMSVANSVENALQNSDEARSYIRAADIDLRDQWEAAIKLRVPGNRGRILTEQANDMIDQSLVYYSRLLAEGKTPAEAKTFTEQRFGPKLNALLPK